MDMDELPTRVLLYRYLFYGWLFRDVNRGSLFERAQAWRHNREQAHWLLTYLRRWAVCGLLGFGAAAVLEAGLSARWPAATLYVGGVVAVSYCVVTFVAWFFLTRDVRLGP
jgi:hypothetical protein